MGATYSGDDSPEGSRLTAIWDSFMPWADYRSSREVPPIGAWAHGRQLIGVQSAEEVMGAAVTRRPIPATGGASYGLGTAVTSDPVSRYAVRYRDGRRIDNALTREVADISRLIDGDPWARRRWTGHHAPDCPCRTCGNRWQ
jgi:hypothetical protein